MDSDPLKSARRLTIYGGAVLGATIASATLGQLLLRGTDNVALGVLFGGCILAGFGASAVLLVAGAIVGVATLAHQPAARRPLTYVLVGSALVIGGALAVPLVRLWWAP